MKRLARAQHEALYGWFVHVFRIPIRPCLSDNVGTPRARLDVLHKLSRLGFITYEKSEHFSRFWGVTYWNIRLTSQGADYLRATEGNIR
jgi:hypothetical protein